ncbi:putative vesicular-fusion protein sec17 [Myxozyma melibiosi]|uniref:Vesicular-fusion protein sec17 n=1 Tax=Myxozyma melibiosi TaxID=54550 RepID=A0ABR1FAH1_9ASCO
MSDAQALLQKAEKKASSSGFFGMLSSSTRYEEAGDLYVEAANAFRLQKDMVGAGKAFEKAAEMQLKSESKDEAANTYVEGYKAFRKVDPSEAARLLIQAITLFTAKGQFRRAATYKQDLAVLYENDLNDLDRAMDAYDDAGEWFSNDGAESLANKAWLKVAEVAALKEDYIRAIAKYEMVAKNSLTNNLTKWSVKDYFFRAGLCHIANKDIVAAKRSVEEYADADPSFFQTREFGLLQDIISAYEDGDQERFTDKVFQFDQFSKLDKWKTTILLRIKNSISEEEENIL